MEDLKILPVTADTAMANYMMITKSKQNDKTTIRQMWADDLKLEIVGSNVPSTN